MRRPFQRFVQAIRRRFAPSASRRYAMRPARLTHARLRVATGRNWRAYKHAMGRAIKARIAQGGMRQAFRRS